MITDRQQRFRLRGEDWEKLCTGPLHREGKWLPLKAYSPRTTGKVRSQCRACEGSRRNGSELYVPYKTIRFAVNELVFRLGKAETARRLGIKPQTLWEWTTNKRKHIQRRNARKIIILLYEVRQQKIVRHRKSIHHGAAMRGKIERVPTQSKDFNGPDNRDALRSAQARRALRRAA